MAGTQAPSQGRIAALDGLRGVAAVIVVVFHYLSMLHPSFVENFAEGTLHWLARTPVTLLWNGNFAVLVFFVLSGFVMAAAAHRRADQLLANLVTRYVRLGLPAATSVLLALAWLSAFPTAAQDLARSLEAPSPWLGYTLQGELPSVWEALYEGAVGIFVTGQSSINNVLWTMKIELFGSIALFAIYWGARDSVILRLAGLAALSVLCLTVLRDAYLCFVAGALFYEARRRDLLARLPAWSSALALAAGIAGGWAVSHYVLDTDFAVIWPNALAIVTGGVLATLAAGLAFAWAPLAARPARVLRARE